MKEDLRVVALTLALLFGIGVALVAAVLFFTWVMSL